MAKKSTPKRKSISKKLRFEIFKRDSFKCQYCGNSAPNVVLEIDHIDPVSKGGKNDILNLITSCFDCNRGKRNNRLDTNETLNKQLEQLEILNEKKEQLKMMVQWKEGLMDIEHDTIAELSKHWTKLTGYSWNDNGLKTMRRHCKKYSYIEIIEAMDISAEKYIEFGNDGIATEESWENAFDKIGGILYYHNQTPEEREVEQIKMYCKNSRMRYYNAYSAKIKITEYQSKGHDMNDLMNHCHEVADFEDVIWFIEKTISGEI